MSTTLLEKPPHIPPGQVVDFDIYAPPGGKHNLYAGWKTLLDGNSPDLVWTPRNEGHWIPLRAEIIKEVMRDYERFSSRTIIIPKSHGKDHNLIPTTIDPPRHHPYRLSLNESLAAPVIKGMEKEIREIAVELVEEIEKQGKCNFTTDFAEILPIKIFMNLMDLPLEDTAQTKYWSDQLIRPDGSMTFVDALGNLTNYMAPFVEQRTGGSGTDMLSHLINRKIDGRHLTLDECLKLAVQVLVAGIDTVVNFLGFVFLHLASHPDLRKKLTNNSDLIADAVEEFLRRFPIVTVGREVRKDIEFHGVKLKAGEMIAAPTPLAGLDPLFNDNPEQFDLDRIPRHSITFGAGNHICPGRNLARAEIRITLEEWMKRIPDFQLAPDAKITFSSGIVGVLDSLPLVWTGD